MKIVHVVYSLELGGAEVLVAQLCRTQRSNGHDVSVCAYSMLGPVGEALRADGFVIRVLGEAHPARTMLTYLRLFWKLKPDVVHCHNPAPTLQAAPGARLAGVACVIATRHSLVSPPYDRAAEIKFGLFSYFLNWVVGICDITCENLRHAPAARKSRIVRVYNGSAPLVRTTEDRAAGAGLTLLFVGRLAVIKDLPTLLRAVALSVKQVPDLKLWIVGDGPVRSELEALTSALGITSHVRFWGQQMEVAEFYQQCDVFAMSSVSEGLPMSLLQAMSLGLPAVLTDVGGMREVMHLSQSGLLSPVGDAAAMAGSIVRLAQDAGLREQFSQSAIAAYNQHFTLGQMDAAYMALYRGERPLSRANPSRTEV